MQVARAEREIREQERHRMPAVPSDDHEPELAPGVLARHVAGARAPLAPAPNVSPASRARASHLNVPVHTPPQTCRALAELHSSLKDEHVKALQRILLELSDEKQARAPSPLWPHATARELTPFAPRPSAPVRSPQEDVHRALERVRGEAPPSARAPRAPRRQRCARCSRARASRSSGLSRGLGYGTVDALGGWRAEFHALALRWAPRCTSATTQASASRRRGGGARRARRAGAAAPAAPPTAPVTPPAAADARRGRAARAERRRRSRG